jgi:ElaB/YqjD/DUF883 family membrane-anchored ribosome-binding protein
MSILSELRRLLFGAKAVAKSGAEKAGDKVTESTREAREDFDAWLERVRRESGIQPPEGPNVPPPPSPDKEPPDTITHRMSETGEALRKKAEHLAEETGKRVLATGKKVEDEFLNPLAQKAGEVAEKTGEKILEKGSDILDRAQDFLREAKEKTGEELGKVYDKAQEEAARHQAEKAALDAELKARADKYRPASPQGKDHKEALDDALLSGTDDFFEKADQFAKGNYRHGMLDIEPGEKTERPRSNAPTAGFEDRDGDGDDIIDDAEIVEDLPEK